MKHLRVFRRLPADEPPPRKGHILRGLCDIEEGTIYINPKQSDREMLITVVHEALHYLFPKRTEPQTEHAGIIIGEALWKFGYRSRHRRRSKAK